MRDFISIIVAFIVSQTSFSQNKVLIIGIDGCRADALEKAYTPNLDSLKNAGIYCPTSWQLGKTKSGPGWSSMLTGVWDQKHNVSDNKFSGHNFEKYPFFPSYLKKIDVSKKSVLVVGWKSLFKISKDTGWDNCLAGKSDNDCLSKTLNLLKNADYDVTMVHFNDVDFTGHTTGFELDNKKYIKAIEEVDRKIGKILRELKNRPNYKNENWLILSSTDHGGTGKHHSGNSIEERKIWWIASSKDLQKMEIVANDPGSYFYENMSTDSSIINYYPSIVDIAATAINHVFPNLTNKDFQAWGLDGRSWLNFNIEKTVDFYSESSTEQTQKECKYFNNACSIEITLKELKK